MKIKRQYHFYFTLLVSFIAVSAQAQYYIRVEKLGSQVNSSSFDELGPVLAENDRKMYFTRTASPDFVKTYNTDPNNKNKPSLEAIYSEMTGKEISDISNSSFNQDIWYADLDATGKPSEVYHPGFPLNNAFPNSVCAEYSTENALIVINQFHEDGSVSEGFSIVRQNSNGYEVPVPMDIHDYKDWGNNVNLTLSEDGDKVFVSMRGNSDYEGNDIYFSVRIGSNLWSPLKKLDAPINSPYNESSPFLTKDGKMLIFASNRIGGMGKHDLYYSKRLDFSYQKWSEPIPFEAPINTEHEEFLANLDASGKFLYFSSNRDGTSDIFRANLKVPEHLEKHLQLTLKIVHAETKEVLRGEIQWKFLEDDAWRGFFRSYSGIFDHTVKKTRKLVFKVEKRGFTSETVQVDPMQFISQDITKKEIEIYLHPGKKIIPKAEYPFPFVKHRTFRLDEIYFGKGSPQVLPKSKRALNRLAEILKKHPKLEIEIEGHTDNVGDEAALMELSLNRAKAIRAQLVVSGVEENRILVRGYGASKPLNGNTTERERQKNRRVEIRLIKE